MCVGLESSPISMMDFASKLKDILVEYDNIEPSSSTRQRRQQKGSEIVKILTDVIHARNNGLLAKMETYRLGLNSFGLDRLPLDSTGGTRFGLPETMYSHHYQEDVEEASGRKGQDVNKVENDIRNNLELLKAVLLWTRHLLHRRPQLSFTCKKRLINEVLLPLLRHDQVVKDLHLEQKERLRDQVSYPAVWVIMMICYFPLPGDLADGFFLDCEYDQLVSTGTEVHYRSSVADYFTECVLCKNADLLQVANDLLADLCESRSRWGAHNGLNTERIPFSSKEILQKYSKLMEAVPSSKLIENLPEAALLGDQKKIWPFLLNPWSTIPHSVIMSRLLNSLCIFPIPEKTYKDCLDEMNENDIINDRENDEKSDDDMEDHCDEEIPTFFALSNLNTVSSENFYRRSYARLWLNFLALDLGFGNKCTKKDCNGSLRKGDASALLDIIPDRCLPYLHNPLALSSFFFNACRDTSDPVFAFNCLKSYFDLITLYRLPEDFHGGGSSSNNEGKACEDYFDMLYNLITPSMFYHSEGTQMRELLSQSVLSSNLPRKMLQKFIKKLADISLCVVAEDAMWLMTTIEKVIYHNYAILAPMALGIDKKLQYLAEKSEVDLDGKVSEEGVPIVTEKAVSDANLVALVAFVQGLNPRTKHQSKRLLNLDRERISEEQGGLFKKMKI